MTNQERINLHNHALDKLKEAQESLVNLGIGYSHSTTVPLSRFIEYLQGEMSRGRTTISLEGIGTVLVDGYIVVLTTEPQL